MYFLEKMLKGNHPSRRHHPNEGEGRYVFESSKHASETNGLSLFVYSK